ncbi:MAG: hypothetical protein Q4A55_02755 [Aerococcus sp.]|nr:hypothetical protein [Aerococcus sp.]
MRITKNMLMGIGLGLSLLIVNPGEASADTMDAATRIDATVKQEQTTPACAIKGQADEQLDDADDFLEHALPVRQQMMEQQQSVQYLSEQTSVESALSEEKASLQQKLDTRDLSTTDHEQFQSAIQAAGSVEVLYQIECEMEDASTSLSMPLVTLIPANMVHASTNEEQTETANSAQSVKPASARPVESKQVTPVKSTPKPVAQPTAATSSNPAEGTEIAAANLSTQSAENQTDASKQAEKSNQPQSRAVIASVQATNNEMITLIPPAPRLNMYLGIGPLLSLIGALIAFKH